MRLPFGRLSKARSGVQQPHVQAGIVDPSCFNENVRLEEQRLTESDCPPGLMVTVNMMR